MHRCFYFLLSFFCYLFTCQHFSEGFPWSIEFITTMQPAFLGQIYMTFTCPSSLSSSMHLTFASSNCFDLVEEPWLSNTKLPEPHYMRYSSTTYYGRRILCWNAGRCDPFRISTLSNTVANCISGNNSLEYPPTAKKTGDGCFLFVQLLWHVNSSRTAVFYLVTRTSPAIGAWRTRVFRLCVFSFYVHACECEAP